MYSAKHVYLALKQGTTPAALDARPARERNAVTSWPSSRSFAKFDTKTARPNTQAGRGLCADELRRGCREGFSSQGWALRLRWARHPSIIRQVLLEVLGLLRKCMYPLTSPQRTLTSSMHGFSRYVESLRSSLHHRDTRPVGVPLPTLRHLSQGWIARRDH